MPTPALVAPLEFTMDRAAYLALGGHAPAIRSLGDILRDGGEYATAGAHGGGRAMTGPQAAWLPDGRRLHLHHGPIDLILEAWGAPEAARAAYRAAVARFDGLLQELVDELPALRSPRPVPLARAGGARHGARGGAASPEFVTPMAAVAGAVADAVSRR